MVSITQDKPDVVLLLHRLVLDDRARETLVRLGVRIVQSETLARTLRLMAEPASRVLIAFDMAGGGSAPEKIVSAAREGALAQRVDLLPASSKRSSAAARRAQRLGFPEAWVWPDGAFAEFLRRLEANVQVSFHRAAPRATLPRAYGRLELGGGITAEIINISSTGALVETDPSGGDIEAIGFEISVAAQTFLVLARVVWRETEAKRVRLGVQFTNVDDKSRAAIESFVHSVNVLRPDEPSPGLRFAAPKRERVRVRQGKRSDWFDMEGDLERGATLVPKKAFFVPYRVGDTLVIETSEGEKHTNHEVRVIASSLLEPRRIDSRIGWHVVPAALVAPASTDPEDREIRIATDLLSQGKTVGQLIGACRAGRLAEELTGVEWVLLTPQLLRPSSDLRTAGVYTRTFFAKRQREGAADLDGNFVMHPLPLKPGGEPQHVGRSRSCAVHLPLLNVSKHHASFQLAPEDGALLVTDLGSANGSAVLRLHDGEPVLEPLPANAPSLVKDGEVILVGRHPLHLLHRDSLIRAVTALAERDKKA